MGQVGYFIFGIGSKSFVAIRTRVISHREAYGAHARVGLEALECHRRLREFPEIGLTVDAVTGLVRRASIT
jgi:hypothetical protein